MRTRQRPRGLIVLVLVVVLVGLTAPPLGAADGDTSTFWIRPYQISHPGISGEEPAISGDGDHLLTAWSTGTRIYSRWSIDGGTTWGARFLIGRGEAASVSAYGSSGTVAWWHNGTVYTRHYDGSVWQPRNRVSPVGQACSYPGTYATGNTVGITYWRCKTPPASPWLLTDRRSTDGGVTWYTTQTLQRVTDLSTWWAPYDPPATAASGQNVYIVVTIPIAGGRHALYSYSSPDTGATWNRYQVYRTLRPIDSPRVAVYGNRAHIMWRQWTPTPTVNSIWYQRCRQGGMTCGVPTKLSTGAYNWYPQSIAAHGQYLRAGFSKNGVLYYRDSVDYGASWYSRYRIDGYTGWACYWRMWGDSTGTHTVFHHDGTGTFRVYYTAGDWSAP